jgi:hypothetical protein
MYLSKVQDNSSSKTQPCGLSGRTPALQVQSPEFKPQSHKKKKKKKKKSNHVFFIYDVMAPSKYQFLKSALSLLTKHYYDCCASYLTTQNATLFTSFSPWIHVFFGENCADP